MEPLSQDIRVIALGNPLRRDDGVGLEALNRLKQQDWSASVRFIVITSYSIHYTKLYEDGDKESSDGEGKE